jgi:hypothetical protein
VSILWAETLARHDAIIGINWMRFFADNADYRRAMGDYPENFTLEQPAKIEGDATFARNRTLRLQLRRWWVERPKRWAAWLLLNPSHASAKRDDPTMGRVIYFTRAWGYDGCIVVNAYPFITSDPREMWAWSRWQDNGPDWYARDDMQSNLAEIEEVGRRSCLRVVAFGAQPILHDEGWIEQCLERFEQPFDYPDSGWAFDERLMCLGVTKDGQPIHPLARGKNRVSDDARPVFWKRS